MGDEDFGSFLLWGLWRLVIEIASMRIIRPDQSWCILFPAREERLCLHRLALQCGYRVGELCSELEISERYLYVVFTRDIGLPPKEWMRRDRMVVARRKLTGGKTPEEVTKDLGFATKSNFLREFRGVHRVSPGVAGAVPARKLGGVDGRE